MGSKARYEELEEGAWLEPGLALLRQKVKENWSEKHRNAASKIFLEGGWTQKRLFDVDWSDISKCQACQKEEGTEKPGSATAQNGTKSDERFQRFSENGNKRRHLQKSSGSGLEIL